MLMNLDPKMILSNALRSLLREKPFEKITVEEILKKSGIARSTFYRYFTDKYSLMNWAYMAEVDEIIRSNPNLCKSQNIIIESARFIKKNEDYFVRVIKYKGQNSFIDFIAEYARKTTIERISKSIGNNEISQEILFSIDFYCGGLTFTITKWLESGLKESANRIAELVFDCIPQTIKIYME